MFSHHPYTGRFYAKDREVASINLTESRLRLDEQAKHAKIGFTLLYLAGGGFFIGTPVSYLLTKDTQLAIFCGGIGILCGIGGVFFHYAQSLLQANVDSIKLQLEDFHSKETALMNILDFIEDLFRSEFRKLGYPRRAHAESSLEISRALERDLCTLTNEHFASISEVQVFMKQLRESEGIARLTGLTGYLTTTGFQHEAVEELFGLLRERLDDVLHIVRTKPVQTKHGVELIMAALRFDEALRLVREYHDERSPVSLDDVRSERARRDLVAE